MRLLLVALLLAHLSACAPSVPPLARGGDAAFKARMADRYPPGTSGERLRADLAADGFAIAADAAGRGFTAFDTPDNLPCLGRTRVDWREDARGRIGLLTAQRADCS